MKTTIIETLETLEVLRAETSEQLAQANRELVTSVCQCLTNEVISHSLWGNGIIKEASDDASILANVRVAVEFESVGEKVLGLFAMIPQLQSKQFVKISFESADVSEIVDKAYTIFKAFDAAAIELKWAAKVKALEDEREAQSRAKAEANFERQKANNIASFNAMTVTKVNTQQSDDFYFALGWLVTHVGTVSAALPDYLAKAFAKHFGADTPCRIVDSKHRGPAGWQSQWTWSFSMSLKKAENVPDFLVPFLNPAGKAITDTSFVWGLVMNHGFQFGKKQDKSKIADLVPDVFKDSFVNGLNS